MEKKLEEVVKEFVNLKPEIFVTNMHKNLFSIGLQAILNKYKSIQDNPVPSLNQKEWKNIQYALADIADNAKTSDERNTFFQLFNRIREFNGLNGVETDNEQPIERLDDDEITDNSRTTIRYIARRLNKVIDRMNKK